MGACRWLLFFPVLGFACNYDTIFLNLKVDNFGFGDVDTFKLRILVSDEHWSPSNGPIFLYTGNEGPITDFAENTGFLWDIAEEFKAMIVFAEHRYYGQSRPYTNLSLTDAEYFKYLSTEQVLADFAQVIWYLKHHYKEASRSPVIAFGGSYGAMLAVWLRIKYPHLVQGVLASSAPLWDDPINGTTCKYPNQVTTKAFKRRSKHCVEAIRRSWDVINHFNQTAAGRRFLSDTFHLCKEISTQDDAENFKIWLSIAYFNAAMIDYPTPANFIQPLPAYPTKEMCRPLSNSSLDNDMLMESIMQAMSVYYNYTGEKTCFDIGGSNIDDESDKVYEFQDCTETPNADCADGINDMFEPREWNYQDLADYCFQKYGVIPQNNSLRISYGYDAFKDVGNIIFSNGEFDPWSKEGILRNLSDSVISIWIKDSAHHTDLRSSSPQDPPSVIAARETEKYYIRKWIKEWTNHL